MHLRRKLKCSKVTLIKIPIQIFPKKLCISGDDRFTIEDGPHGGLGGIPFTDGDGINRNGYITALEIRSHSEIDAIRARYGETWGDWHGGTGGEFYEVTLNEGAYIYLVQGNLNNF